eukprot:m51a1_g8058 hypothetical protein (811) ;mRNA; f:129072-132120
MELASASVAATVFACFSRTVYTLRLRNAGSAPAEAVHVLALPERSVVGGLAVTKGGGGALVRLSAGRVGPGEEAELELEVAQQLPLERRGAGAVSVLRVPAVAPGSAAPLSLAVAALCCPASTAALRCASHPGAPLAVEGGSPVQGRLSGVGAGEAVAVEVTADESDACALWAAPESPGGSPEGCGGEAAAWVCPAEGEGDCGAGAAAAAAGGEFVVAVSVGAGRVRSASDAVVVLLRSLPLGCHFNSCAHVSPPLVACGARARQLYGRSVRYSEETLRAATRFAQRLAGNAGGGGSGGGVLAALRAALGARAPKGPEMARQVFVVTDGDGDAPDVADIEAYVSLCTHRDVDARAREALEAGVCTYTRTGSAYARQYSYQCETCGLTGKTACCALCAATCHAGHQLSGAHFGGCYCDCGALGAPKCLCCAPSASAAAAAASCAAVPPATSLRRVFALGVGRRACAGGLVAAVARAGGGTAEHAPGGAVLAPLLRQLRAALRPSAAPRVLFRGPDAGAPLPAAPAQLPELFAGSGGAAVYCAAPRVAAAEVLWERAPGAVVSRRQLLPRAVPPPLARAVALLAAAARAEQLGAAEQQRVAHERGLLAPGAALYLGRDSGCDSAAPGVLAASLVSLEGPAGPAAAAAAAAVAPPPAKRARRQAVTRSLSRRGRGAGGSRSRSRSRSPSAGAGEGAGAEAGEAGASAEEEGARALARVAAQQRASGAYEPGELLARALGVPLGRLLGGDVLAEEQELWATAVACAWLARFLGGLAGEWGLMAAKSRAWLAQASRACKRSRDWERDAAAFVAAL